MLQEIRLEEEARVVPSFVPSVDRRDSTSVDIVVADPKSILTLMTRAVRDTRCSVDQSGSGFGSTSLHCSRNRGRNGILSPRFPFRHIFHNEANSGTMANRENRLVHDFRLFEKLTVLAHKCQKGNKESGIGAWNNILFPFRPKEQLRVWDTIELVARIVPRREYNSEEGG